MKKTLCIILSAVLLLTLLPGFALGATIVDSGTCGDALTWTLDDEGLLTINGTGKMADYDYYSVPWGGSAEKCERIKTVVVGTGVTSIGEYAFFDCTGLTTVAIPDGVTSVGSSAFFGCKGLTNVTIPDGVTSIGLDAFRYCTGLTNVTIPDGATSIGDFAFYGCTGLTSVTIPNGVTSIGDRAFSGCTGLTNVTIPDSVTSIGFGAFDGCTGLTDVTIGAGVTSIGNWSFSGFDAKIWYTGTREQWAAVENQSGKEPFAYECLFENGFVYNAEKTIIYGLHDSTIREVTIPDSVTGIGDSAFANCTGLTSVTIPDSVTSIESYAFRGCTGLTDVTIGAGVTSIGNYAFFDCTGLTSVTIGNGMTSIGGGAFSGCTGLTSVTIPASVTKIEENAFYNDSKLKTVYFTGTEEQWDAVEIKDGNIALLRAKVIFPCQITGQHTWNDGEITTPANCANEGVKTFTCTVCKTTKTEPVAKTADHTDANRDGVCDVCGQKLIPDAGPIATDSVKEKADAVFAVREQKAEDVLKSAGEGAAILKPDGTALSAGELVGSGMKLKKADGIEKVIIIKGDNDGDGKVTASDARNALRMAVNLPTDNGGQAWEKEASRVNDGKTLSAADARLILRGAVNLENPTDWFKAA